MNYAIETNHFSKSYGDVQAANDIKLRVEQGEIYGFLGLNGAGKTTTIRALLGMIRPSAGEVKVLGQEIGPHGQGPWAQVGYLVESPSAYPDLTVRENLDIHRRLTGMLSSDVDETMELLGISALADRRTGHLSLGNKQRLSLARAILHKPEVLLLDEPANGLDPAGIIEVRELLRRLVDESGATVFMSSHILAEVAHLADRIGIVHEGRLLEEMDYDELQARSRRYLEVCVDNPDRATGLLMERMGVKTVERTAEDALHIFDRIDDAADIARLMVESGIELSRLVEEKEDLESYFIRLTGGGLE